MAATKSFFTDDLELTNCQEDYSSLLNRARAHRQFRPPLPQLERNVEEIAIDRGELIRMKKLTSLEKPINMMNETKNLKTLPTS